MSMLAAGREKSNIHMYYNVDFIALNLHQLTDSKAQLNKTNVNNCKSNYLAG